MLKPLVQKAVDAFKGGERRVVLVAPTGYGKTEGAPYAWRASGMPRAIHVAPMRSLVRAVYEKWLRHAPAVGLSNEDVGWQYMGKGPGKSPYFLRRAVATTFDSFVYNMFKLPVARWASPTAHYELPRSAIASAFVIFDEAHLYGGDPGAGDSTMFAAFLTAYKGLAERGNPIFVATATLPKSVLDRLDAYVVHAREEGAECEAKIKTHVVESVDLVKLRGRNVLVVANTVRGAVRYYREAVEKLGNTLLIHGRYTARDRREREEQLAKALEGGRYVVVATQVVEVGVDIDADVLVTEAAPLAQLVQRAGRVCRRVRDKEGNCVRRECEVYVIEGSGSGIYDKELVEKTLVQLSEDFPWRTPWDYLDRVYDGVAVEEDRRASELLRLLDVSLWLTRVDAKKVATVLCGFARDSVMVPAYVGRGGDDDVEEMSVPISPRLYDKLREDGHAIGVVREGRLVRTSRLPDDICQAIMAGDIDAVWVDPALYSTELGLVA